MFTESVVVQLRKLYLSQENRKNAKDEEVTILEAAERQYEYDELAQFDVRDDEHSTHDAEVAMVTHRRENPSSSPRAAEAGQKVLNWGVDLVQHMRRRVSFHVEHADPNAYGAVRNRRTEDMAEIEAVLRTRAPWLKKLMYHLVSSIDTILSTPFVYLAKGSDPIAVQQAIDYITSNELTNNIIVLHFVDDRKPAKIHTHVMRKLGNIVETGKLEIDQAEKIGENLVKQTYKDSEQIAGEIDEGHVDDIDFELEDTLPALSSNVLQLVKGVALQDTFHA
jgi:hypothetical protein